MFVIFQRKTAALMHASSSTAGNTVLHALFSSMALLGVCMAAAQLVSSYIGSFEIAVAEMGEL
jgi:hypothetical protein